MTTPQRRAIQISGQVQGVGFRPFVYRLAVARRLSGFVRNDGVGVTIEIQGTPAALNDFLHALRQPPPLARIDALDNGYGKNAAPQLAEALPAYKKYAVGLEKFTGWANVENLAGTEVQKCFSGEETAAEAIANVEKIVQQETGL